MQSNIRQGALFLLLGEALLAVMGGLIKFLSETLSTEQIVFFRNAAGLLILLPLIVNQGSKLLKTKVWHWHLMRGVVGVSAMYCYFWALGHMPLTEAFLVKLSSPFFMPLIGLLWLGERAGKFSIAAVFVGFTGVACILRPDDSTFTFIAMVALLGAFLAALAKVTIRRMSGSESSQTIVFYFAMIAALISAPGAALHWQPVAAPLWGWILLLGLVATLGQLALTHAYRIAPTGKVGVYAYSAVLYGALMGWLIWDEIPLWTTWLGAALIVAAGLLNLYKPAKR
jgi:drug/metabolite transporter (DMT)-like permease